MPLLDVLFLDVHAKCMTQWRYEGKMAWYHLPSFEVAKQSGKSYADPMKQMEYRAIMKEEEMIAFYRLQPFNDGVSMSVGVAPKWCHKGIGKKVIETAMQRAKMLGYQKIRVNIRQWNQTAIHLFQTFHFQMVNEIQDEQNGNILMMEWQNQSLVNFYERLRHSSFRSSFHLGKREKEYVRKNGYDTLMTHACHFVQQRLQDSHPNKDGKQTPWKGHPVFIAQHATGCCCRGCLSKWHSIPLGKALSKEEECYIVSVLMGWIRNEVGL